MVLYEIYQGFKGCFLNELRVSFKYSFQAFSCTLNLNILIYSLYTLF